MFNYIIILTAEYVFLLSILIYVIYFLRADKKIKISLVRLSIISFPLAYLMAKVSSLFINDPRPFVSDHVKPLITHIADNGFPSDHTLLTMAIAAVIFVYNRKLGIILTIIAMTIGIARVLAGIHHLEDIIASAFIAIVATYISVVLLRRLIKQKKRK